MLHAKKTELENGLAEAKKASREATCDRQQATVRSDPQDSREALCEQISGAVIAIAWNPSPMKRRARRVDG